MLISSYSTGSKRTQKKKKKKKKNSLCKKNSAPILDYLNQRNKLLILNLSGEEVGWKTGLIGGLKIQYNIKETRAGKTEGRATRRKLQWGVVVLHSNVE
jgi:hypothetical protein